MKLTYEDCVELREAGFPQERESVLGTNSVAYMSSSIDDVKGYTFYNTDNGDAVYVPSLSELIERCGAEFGALERRGDGVFIAKQYFERGNEYKLGNSGEQAVKNLWIALNKQ